MKNMPSLSSEQKDRVPEFRKKWLGIGLSIGPANRAKVEQGVFEAYQMAGITLPKQIVWCDSIDHLQREMKRFKDALGSPLKGDFWTKLYYKAYNLVFKAMPESLWHSAKREAMGGTFRFQERILDALSEFTKDTYYLPYDVGTFQFYDYLRQVFGLIEETESIMPLFKIVEHGSGFAPYEKICFLLEKPIHFRYDSEGRFHGDGKPAVEYPDGEGLYYWHGLSFPAKYGRAIPEKWETSWILEEENAEIRRILIEQIGYERLVQELGVRRKNRWNGYTLLKVKHAHDQDRIRLLSMECPSTGQIYYLRVPPKTQTAREALQWINHGIDKTEFIVET